MSRDLHKFTVRAGLTAKDMSVELDGEPLNGVCGLSFSVRADKFMTINLVMMGEVFVEGEYRPREIAHIKREVLHPGYLRYRVRAAFKRLFVGADDAHVDGLTQHVLRDLEAQGDAA
jgi:hypothetical protein